jgi:ubiquinone/menaquinone biosynthesis C-methylase UbiE
MISLALDSSFCDRVIGIDISPNQIANAIEKDNVEYRCHKGEDLTFLESNSVDLITTATTFHWLDIEAFVEQVQRVLKPNTGVLAVWTYGTGGLDNPKADAVYNEFNQVRLFPYWNSKRWLIDDFYQSLLPLFPYKSTLVEHTIEQRMETTIEKFLGFTETFSACQTFRRQEGENAYRELIENFRQKLIESYPKNTSRNNHEDETIDLNSMKIIESNPIRLYLMKKQ